MFILGFSSTSLDSKCSNIQKAIQSGLGGIILFSENISSYEQTAQLTCDLQKAAKTPLFISIDQEGGKVERTINIKNKLNYLTPAELSETENTNHIQTQANIMSQELKYMGVNMNFAPVIDVNTNKNNPIIGVRSFGKDPNKVMKFAKPVYKSFLNNSIIPVIKHFPGHGETGEDSHLTMPMVNLSLEELENTHIKPFTTAIDNGVNAVMVSHVHYKAFDKECLPASLSKNIIKHYLRDKIKFNGLVISDDMVMGGVKNYYDSFDSCIKAINAGVDVFIFRDSSDETLNLIEKLWNSVKAGDLAEERIDESVKRILECKQKFDFFNQKTVSYSLNIDELQGKLDSILI